jgi:hypothetical protein
VTGNAAGDDISPLYDDVSAFTAPLVEVIIVIQ